MYGNSLLLHLHLLHLLCLALVHLSLVCLAHALLLDMPAPWCFGVSCASMLECIQTVAVAVVTRAAPTCIVQHLD